MKTLIIAVMALASIPAFAGNKVECAVLTQDIVYPGYSFPVKVVKVPSYPGGWVSPTFTITGDFNTGDVSYTETVSKYGVTYISAELLVPSNATGTAIIEAVVSEPVNKKKVRETVCSAEVYIGS